MSGEFKDFITEGEGYSFDIPGKWGEKDYVCTVTRKDDTVQVELHHFERFTIEEANAILDYVEGLRDSYPTEV